MGIATVSNGETMVDQKTTFVVKFVCGYGVCVPFSLNERIAVVFSLINNMAVSNEKKNDWP